MTTDTFDRFTSRTGTDIHLFLSNFVDFFDNYYQNIADYYTNNGVLNSITLTKLSDLVSFRDSVRNSFNVNIDILGDLFDMWELLDQFEECSTKIDTALNSQKWFRSNKILGYDNGTEKDHVLGQGETLSLLADDLGYTTPNDDWINVALRNQLREEDYTEEGGNKLKVVFQNNADYKLKGIVGAISGQTMLGRDICKKIQYINNDIYVLSYIDTAFQSLNILMNTFKGSVPEFPDDGIDKRLAGSNINSIQYPVIFRQISKIISKDDSFKSVTLSSITNKDDVIFVNFKIQARTGDEFSETQQL